MIRLLLALVCIESFGVSETQSASDPSTKSSDKLILAHYMPWYVARPFSKNWGWHWTMNSFDPEKRIANGKRTIASHYYPMIGPYDSGDPHVIEYHLLLMKLAGIDGVIVDWYGLTDYRDYPLLHRNTVKLVEAVTRLNMQFAICYEDQTIPALVEAGRIEKSSRVSHATLEVEWMQHNWFSLQSYVHSNDRPVLLSFGQNGLNQEEWEHCLAQLKSPVSYFSQHHRRSVAVGAFDWPVPTQGLKAQEAFRDQSQRWDHSISVAFPRFVDIYAEAKVHKSWGRIEDVNGTTFETTLERAVSSSSHIVQIATWNDWGEGTSIEPSREFKYRDLEFVQQIRRKKIDHQFRATSSDLRIPVRLLRLRRELSGIEEEKAMDAISDALARGQLDDARSRLADLDPSRERK